MNLTLTEANNTILILEGAPFNIGTASATVNATIAELRNMISNSTQADQITNNLDLDAIVGPFMDNSKPSK